MNPYLHSSPPASRATWWRELLVIAILLFLTGAILPALQDDYPEDVVPNTAQAWQLRKQGIEFDATDPTERNYLLLGIQIVLYGTLALLAWPQRRRLLTAARSNPWLVAFVAFALLSCAWSEVPGFSARRWIWASATAAFGVYFGTVFTIREQIALLRRALLAGAFLSIALVIASPAHGIDHGVHAGAWRGVFATKNSLGHVMALGALVTIAGMRLRRYSTSQVLSLVLFTALLALSRSMTGAITLTVTLLVLFLIPMLRKKRGLLMAGLVGLIGGSCAVLFRLADVGSMLAALGRDSSLSGRTELWSSVYSEVLKHPWSGWGFSGFWLGWHGPSANVWAQVGWAPPHAHNGYLDLWLQIGAIGLGLFLVTVGTTLWHGLDNLRSSRSLEQVWPLCYVVFLLLYNFTETAVLKQDTYSWALFVSAVVWTSGVHLLRARQALRARAAIAGKPIATVAAPAHVA